MSEQKEPYLKTVYVKDENYVDSETGEILSQDRMEQDIVITEKEEFFITYARLIGLWKDLTGAQIKVLGWLIINQSSNNKVYITKNAKEEISQEMNLRYSTVNNSVKPLVDKGVLIKQSEGRSATYIIHPKYAWKGNMKERNNMLKFILKMEYKPNE